MKKAAHRDLTYMLMAPCPWMTELLETRELGDSHIFCHIHSANKHFFEVGKD